MDSGRGSRRIGKLFMAGCLVIGLCTQSAAESEQRVEVTIRDYTFVLTKQIPLRLGVPTIISIRNVDPERHDFCLLQSTELATVKSSANATGSSACKIVMVDPTCFARCTPYSSASSDEAEKSTGINKRWNRRPLTGLAA